MSSLNKITRCLLILSLPVIAMASGCQSSLSRSAITNELTAPTKADGLIEPEKSVSMSMAGNKVSKKSTTNVDSKQGSSIGAGTQKMPPEVSKYLNSARQLELAGRYQESITQFEWLLNNGYGSALVNHRLAVLYDKTGQSDRSLAYYGRAIEQEPDNAELLCDIGYRSTIDGDLKTAAIYYEVALKNSPNLDRAHNNLAVVLARSNCPDLAISHFLEAGCTQQEAQHNLAQITNAVVALAPTHSDSSR